jgi:hypothetical protein
MAWVKRYLSLVISGVIALAVLGFGVYYLLEARKRNSAVDTEIEQAKSDLNRLMNLDPFPSPSNINIARRELERMTTFVASAKQLFPATPAPQERLTDQSFKSVLQTTIAALNTQALASGIKLETNYYYSFENQRRPINFAPESLLPLSERLKEVHAIATLLFKSKINRLEAIRRAAVPGETATGPDYLVEAPRTNAESNMLIFPYEFIFHSFSPEIGAVLEGIARLPEAAVVRSVYVEPADAAAQRRQDPAQPQPGQPPGFRGRPGAPQRPGAPAAAPGLQTVLEEQALRVILKVDVIKPMPPRPPGGPGGRRGFGS